MVEVWVGIILLTTQLGAVVDKEFDRRDECWSYYLNHHRMKRLHNQIPSTRPVMLFEIQSFGLAWITCERRYKFKGNRIDKFSPNILLPTPEVKND